MFASPGAVRVATNLPACAGVTVTGQGSSHLKVEAGRSVTGAATRVWRRRVPLSAGANAALLGYGYAFRLAHGNWLSECRRSPSLHFVIVFFARQQAGLTGTAD